MLGNKWYLLVYKTPSRFLITTVVSVFTAEALIMQAFTLFPTLPAWIETFLDSSFLTLLILPSLYFFQYRPLTLHIAERLLIENELRESEAKLKVQSQQLQQTPEILQAEKMSSLGRLVTGLAYEINSPVEFINTNISRVKEYVEHLLYILNVYHNPQSNEDKKIQISDDDVNFFIEDLPQVLDTMQDETEKIQQIMQSLRNFSRADESRIKYVNIHEGIDSALLILKPRLHNSGRENTRIQIIKEYADLPKVECYPGELNQVLMNLLSNAIDSLEKRNEEDLRTIHISTQLIDKWVKISVKDNGQGITEQVQGQMFEPFFTTKAKGKGAGLGLSISHQIIVNMHGGKLEFTSKVGQGTEFSIGLPLDKK
jgi:two-component system, NtrC family, sensor kinase